MMGGNHAISGAAAWLAIAGTAPALPALSGLDIPMTTNLFTQAPAVALLGGLLAAGAAILPDSDHHSATIARSVPGLGPAITSTIGRAAGGHRGGTHTVWALLVVTIVAWMLQFLTWDSHSAQGAIGLGLGAASIPLIAFAAKSIKAIWFVRTWPVAWLVGAFVGVALTLSLRGDLSWMPAAIATGYASHLIGDLLTTGGIAPLFPVLPKPPAWWSSSPFLGRIWMKNGYLSIPLLGNTGSAREWALGLALTFYVLYCALHEAQHLVGLI